MCSLVPSSCGKPFPEGCYSSILMPMVPDLVTKHVSNMCYEHLTSTRQTRKPQCLLFLTLICLSSADTPPAVPFLHLWRSRVFSESPKCQMGRRTRKTVPGRQKQKKSNLTGENPTIIQEIKSPSPTCKNIILSFSQIEKKKTECLACLNNIGPRYNEVFYHYVSLILF